MEYPVYAFMTSLLMSMHFEPLRAGGCTNECVWGTWDSWHCEGCCQVWSAVNSAYRYRSLCCSAEPDIQSCLKKCHYSQNQTTDGGACSSHCPCKPPPTTKPPIRWPPTPNMPTRSTSGMRPGTTRFRISSVPPTKIQRYSTHPSSVKPTDLSSKLAPPTAMIPLYSLPSATIGVKNNPARIFRLVEMTNGAMTTDRVMTSHASAAGTSGMSREERCLPKCKDAVNVFDCLVKCILRPCETLMNIAGPSLFVVGVIVGSSVTCAILRLLHKKQDQDNKRTVHPTKQAAAAINF